MMNIFPVFVAGYFLSSAGAGSGSSPINGQGLGANEAGILGCQEHNGFGHLFNAPWAAQGMCLLAPLHVRLASLVGLYGYC